MPVFERVRVLGSSSWRNITVFGLSAETGPKVSHGLAAMNFARGKLVVRETRNQYEVEVRNTSSRPVLIPQGERLIGGLQDRMLNVSTFVEPGATVRVPVSCVEHNRWQARRGAEPDTFSIGLTVAGAGVRSAALGSIGAGHRTVDQQVWDSVDQTMTSVSLPESGVSLSRAYEQVEQSGNDALAALPYIEEANGVAVAIGGRVRVVEIFNYPRKCRQSWERVILSVLVDAAGEPEGAPAEEQTVIETLCQAARAEWDTTRAAVWGEETRADIPGGKGIVLEHQGSVIHAVLVTA